MVGPAFSEERHDLAPTVNPELKGNKFADFHNNTWMFQAVYKRDRKGILIDKDNKPVDENDPNWHKMAVHLSDIHLQKGMHCVDCHFGQDAHGTDQVYGAMIDPVETGAITLVCRHGSRAFGLEMCTSTIGPLNAASASWMLHA